MNVPNTIFRRENNFPLYDNPQLNYVSLHLFPLLLKIF